MLQHDNNPVLHGKLEDCIFKLFDSLCRLDCFVEAMFFSDVFIAEQVTPFLLFQKIEGSVNGNFVEPTEEFVVIVIRVQLLIRFDEDALGDIRCVVRVCDHSQSDIEDRLFVSFQENLERFYVTGQTSPDEIFVVRLLHKYSQDGEKLVGCDTLFAMPLFFDEIAASERGRVDKNVMNWKQR